MSECFNSTEIINDFNSFSEGTIFRRQNLRSTDDSSRTERIKNA